MLTRRFWRLTPHALAERAEIHRRREAREWERAAWMVHYLLEAWVKDPPSMDLLLGRAEKVL